MQVGPQPRDGSPEAEDPIGAPQEAPVQAVRPTDAIQKGGVELDAASQNRDGDAVQASEQASDALPIQDVALAAQAARPTEVTEVPDTSFKADAASVVDLLVPGIAIIALVLGAILLTLYLKIFARVRNMEAARTHMTRSDKLACGEQAAGVLRHYMNLERRDQEEFLRAALDLLERRENPPAIAELAPTPVSQMPPPPFTPVPEAPRAPAQAIKPDFPNPEGFVIQEPRPAASVSLDHTLVSQRLFVRGIKGVESLRSKFDFNQFVIENNASFYMFDDGENLVTSEKRIPQAKQWFFAIKDVESDIYGLFTGPAVSQNAERLASDGHKYAALFDRWFEVSLQGRNPRLIQPALVVPDAAGLTVVKRGELSI